LHLGISVDQIAARQAGHLTRIDSLQLGVEGARMYGSCDTGYPCAYQYNISWASESLPLAPEPNPARWLIHMTVNSLKCFSAAAKGGTAPETCDQRSKRRR
jgi:hypothetical protein